MLELALDPGPGLQQAQVQDPQADFLQRGGDIAGGNAQGQALDHRGLADPGGAHQDRVVLPAAQEDIDALADLAVAADDGVDSPGVGIGGQVLGVLVQHRVLRRVAVGGLFRGRGSRTFRPGMFAGVLGPFQQVTAQGIPGDFQQ